MSENTMLFYCKTCQRASTDAKKHPTKYEYNCLNCKGDRVAFGTQTAICDFFRIKETMLARMLSDAPNPSGK
jgi:hypothetical protein